LTTMTPVVSFTKTYSKTGNDGLSGLPGIFPRNYNTPKLRRIGIFSAV
jgi:hypothetical protein